MDIESKFKEWAVKNGFSIEVFAGDYFDKSTQEAWKGWKGAINMMYEEVLFDYGICPQCLTHYVDTGLQDDGGRAMECDCSVDGFRNTKIIQLIEEAAK